MPSFCWSHVKICCHDFHHIILTASDSEREETTMQTEEVGPPNSMGSPLRTGRSRLDHFPCSLAVACGRSGEKPTSKPLPHENCREVRERLHPSAGRKKYEDDDLSSELQQARKNLSHCLRMHTRWVPLVVIYLKNESQRSTSKLS